MSILRKNRYRLPEMVESCYSHTFLLALSGIFFKKKTAMPQTVLVVLLSEVQRIFFCV
jgi:hypothetical protein